MSDVLAASGIDVERLLRAIRQVETSGAPTGLRFEPAYMPRGYRLPLQGRELVGTGRSMSAVAEQRWVRWGPWSSASYGPWQILYHTAADLGYTDHPCDLLHASESWVCALLRRIARQGARTLAEIGDAWNSGNFRDQNVPTEYIARLTRAYEEAA